MSPGGHLVTTAVVCAVAAAHQRWELAAGLVVGGFWIDVDHAVDYVVFDRRRDVLDRRRDLRPNAFLHYYAEGHMQRTVLVLHSWELFAVLAVLAWSSGAAWLVGYVAGGLMHLALDLVFNGRLTPNSIVFSTASPTGRGIASRLPGCSVRARRGVPPRGSGAPSSAPPRPPRPC
jgi:hypothetical protein